MYIVSRMLITLIMIFPLVLLGEYNANSIIAISSSNRKSVLGAVFIILFTLNYDGPVFEVLLGYFVYFVPMVILLSILCIKNSDISFSFVDEEHVLCIKSKHFIRYVTIISVLVTFYYVVSLTNNDDVLLFHNKTMKELSLSNQYTEDIIFLSEQPNTLVGLDNRLDDFLDGESTVVYYTPFMKYIETVKDITGNTHILRFQYRRMGDRWKLVRLVNETVIEY